MMQYSLLTIILCIYFKSVNAWIIEYERDLYKVFMDDEIKVPFNLSTTSDILSSVNVSLEGLSEIENIVLFGENFSSQLNINVSIKDGKAESFLPIKAVFLGQTRIILTLTEIENGHSEELQPLEITVIRKPRIIDKAFTGSVAILVALIYINFGCALDWSYMKTIIRRPIGPAIGFVGQFVIMPLLSYIIGILMFPQSPEMRLGLLFTGVSPAGGASNVWTCLLDGNIDLSITMTTLSTLAAFAAMPAWLFTLGPHVFAEANLGVPYEHIASLAAALIIPLGIGWLIQRFLPCMSRILVKILKCFSAILILFIIVFAIVTNLYLFKLASWRICISGLLLPWCGYILGTLLALVCKQPNRDVIAISIETGVQNTGIAIFLLRFSLPQPQADLTTVVPVSIAVMTPIPLTFLYIYKKIFQKKKNPLEFAQCDELSSIR